MKFASLDRSRNIHIHPSIHPAMHSPILPSIHPASRSSIHPSSRPFIHPPIHTSIHSLCTVRQTDTSPYLKKSWSPTFILCCVSIHTEPICVHINTVQSDRQTPLPTSRNPGFPSLNCVAYILLGICVHAEGIFLLCVCDCV